ncbi:MAG TPA: M20/M25/M40 family metallo-hydrolase [Steroidobacteraceae bacterium]|jgi:acetylornithine deacetylase/succinyl-diaminopimelate desuccinylase-like protein|nr:M20/M25/M40 family metallo-hydrolase [Steroidobacteraceae bacterium]
MRGLTLTLGLAAATALWASPAPPLPPPADQQLARDMLKGLVEINTTHSHGSTDAAKAIQGWLLSAGFAAGDVVFLAPPDHPTKGNVVVRYRGKHSRDAVLFLGHLDVVEAKPEDWSVDPFKLTQQEGWFYGRGTIDMKDGDAALAESLIRLKREKFVPDRDVIVAFTADEEAGGDSNGPAFLIKEHRDLIDAALVVNLDGGGGNTKNGQRQFFEVGTSEKTYLTFTLETTSPGGHGSLPGPDNAIYRLAAGLGRLEAFKFPVMLTATTRASFDQLGALESGPTASDMHAVAKQPPDLAAAERLSQNVRLNAQLRTTCVATLISGGHAENALPQRARATVQCRMLPGDSSDNVRTLLIATLADPAIRVTLDAPPIVSPESPPTPRLMNKVAALAHSMWPNVPIIPTMATGFSDDRQTRNAGMVSYDISGVWQDVDENRAHGRDERIGVQAFDESVEFTYRLLKAMSSAR